MTNDADIDRVCDRFESEWKAGARPQIEAYLRQATEAQRGGLMRELTGLEVEYRLRAGERPLVAEYLQRFPDQRDVVQAVFSKPPPLLPAASGTPDAGEWRLLLQATEGPHKGETFTCQGHDIFLVGRSKQAHLQLRDDYFSRAHFLIEVNPPSCRLMDLTSRNGTFVNGERVRSVELRDGDTIKAGNTVLKVSMPAPAGSAALDAPTLGLPAAQPPAEAPAPAARAPSADAPAETLIWTGAVPPPSTRASRNNGPAPGATPAPLSSTISVAPAALPTIPGYRLVRELGRGGMGVVYLAEGEKDGRQAALKTITPAAAAGRSQVERFLREARILCQLRHHHIVAFLEANEAEGVLYFAMDYIEGVDAGRLLKQKGPLPVRDAVRIVSQVLSALDYAHGQGYVHRDVKPANILLSVEGNRKVVKVADFGLARVYQQSRLSGLTVMGEVGGTVAFMPPEQITHFREVKPAADQYSAAATLYTLLTGRMIFDFENVSVDHQLAVVLEKEPVPIRQRRPDLPEGLAAAVHRALSKDPLARFPNARAFLSPLVPFAH